MFAAVLPTVAMLLAALPAPSASQGPDPVAAGRVHAAWRAGPVASTIGSSPTYAGGSVYYTEDAQPATAPGTAVRITRRDAATGALLPFGADPVATLFLTRPLAAGGRILTLSAYERARVKATVRAYTLEGRTAWKRDLPGEKFPTELVAAGPLVLAAAETGCDRPGATGCAHTTVTAWSAADGTLAWQRTFAGGSPRLAAAAGRLALHLLPPAGTPATATPHETDATTGTPHKSNAITGTSHRTSATTAPHNNEATTGTPRDVKATTPHDIGVATGMSRGIDVTTGRLHGIDAGTGRRLWSRSRVAEGVLAIDGAAVYVAAGRLQAFRATDGKIRFSTPPGRYTDVLAGRTGVFATTATAHVAALDSRGRVRWSSPARPTGPLTAATGVLWFQHHPGADTDRTYLAAVDARTGKRLRTLGVSPGYSPGAVAVGGGRVFTTAYLTLVRAYAAK
ncbi:outer membrane protein assembly factor BamB family protein [Symbioplanes lichenis]|uniref:outer membrane protein assembly factor BamB family protein n=1 Tax=Symbioplanes lichenis TaxID=1629072 RepID=UPI00273819C9|nr:PQQ-binding-like beta-propeller repeat protein [Actinoplanes lichenis]